MIDQYISPDGTIRLKVEDNVWLSSGGVGWTPGRVLGFRVNRNDEMIVKVGYGTLLPSGLWVREGERRPDQVRPRDRDKMGSDKPPSRGKERRKRCPECGSFETPLPSDRYEQGHTGSCSRRAA